jgi:3-deoxy-D-manno-octulosonic acid kinase
LNLSPIVKSSDEKIVLSKQLQPKVLQQGNVYCVFDQQLCANFSPKMLSSDYWIAKNAVTGTAQGRGTTWFIAYQSQQWVLRHYYRGGLIGKFNKDLYWYSNNESTRAAREFALLTTLQQLQLPAPKPVAYRVVKQGLCYRADLLSSRIENAKDLVSILSEKSISTVLMKKIGSTIKRFHEQGIFHHDLNIHNILLDSDDNVWLIDFDQGEQRVIADAWQQANMARLLRSFRKELGMFPILHWQESDWQHLLAGYQA